MKDNINRNGSGCKDPTAAAAITNTSADQKRIGKLMDCLNYVCKIAGFDIEGRVVLRDRETGEGVEVMADIYDCYNGISNIKHDEAYQSKHRKAEPATVRQMTPEEIAKYGPPTGVITPRASTYAQHHKNKKNRKERSNA